MRLRSTRRPAVGCSAAAPDVGGDNGPVPRSDAATGTATGAATGFVTEQDGKITRLDIDILADSVRDTGVSQRQRRGFPDRFVASSQSSGDLADGAGPDQRAGNGRATTGPGACGQGADTAGTGAQGDDGRGGALILSGTDAHTDMDAHTGTVARAAPGAGGSASAPGRGKRLATGLRHLATRLVGR